MTAPAMMRHETSPGPLGSKRTNLVSTRDSGWKKVQFRVQCEVWLPPDVAAVVDSAVMPGPGRTEAALRNAEQLVLAHIPGEATQEFRQIVSLGFKDQRNPEPTGE